MNPMPNITQRSWPANRSSSAPKKPKTGSSTAQPAAVRPRRSPSGPPERRGVGRGRGRRRTRPAECPRLERTRVGRRSPGGTGPSLPVCPSRAVPTIPRLPPAPKWPNGSSSWRCHEMPASRSPSRVGSTALVLEYVGSAVDPVDPDDAPELARRLIGVQNLRPAPRRRAWSPLPPSMSSLASRRLTRP